MNNPGNKSKTEADKSARSITKSRDYSAIKRKIIGLSSKKKEAQKLFGQIDNLVTENEKKQEQAVLQMHSENTAELAGGIAHQFNNILNSITGSVELLDLELPKNSYVKRCYNTIFSSVKRMTALTDKLLAYAKIGRHMPGKTKVNPFIYEAILFVKEIVRPDIDFEVNTGDEMFFVHADSSRLKMAISALITNAAEAVGQGGKIVVSTSCSKDIKNQGPKECASFSGEYLIISISDNGPGMPESVAKRVFQPFFTTKFQGRGLGLSAAHGIISNHDGWIDIDSQPGSGTTAKIFLPLIERKPEKKIISEKIVAQTSASLILIVDDERSIRQLTGSMLKRIGYNTLSAADGKTALEIIEKHHKDIDVVLLDLMLPDINGNEILLRIKKDWPGLKTIVFSGAILDGSEFDGRQLKADSYITKPISLAELHKTIIKLVERRKNKRYAIPSGMFASSVLSPENRHRVINLSTGGLAVKFYDGFCFLEQSSKLSLVSDQHQLKIENIPYIFLQGAFNRIETQTPDTGRVKFTMLSDQQYSEINLFLNKFTPVSK